MVSTEYMLRRRMLMFFAVLAAVFLALWLPSLPPATAVAVCRYGGSIIALAGLALGVLTGRTGFLVVLMVGVSLTLVPLMMRG